MSDWKYYNHALISNLSPHLTPNIDDLKKEWRKFSGHPMLARWTEHFDCEWETEWWYCICDNKFDISTLKAKRRNVINNGIKYCDVFKANPLEYVDGLFQIYSECQLDYSSSKKPISKDLFFSHIKELCNNDKIVFYLCFLKETRELVGYSIITCYPDYIDLTSQKVRPSFEKYQVNAALVYTIVINYNEQLSKNFYICDGSRNIYHKTHFQDFLEKYFGFRKAYCVLKIKYIWWLKPMVFVLYPFHKLFMKFDKNEKMHLLNSLLVMEQYRRACHD